MCSEGCEIQLIAGDEHRHSGPPIVARYLYAVHIGLLDSGKSADRLCHFGGRDIFSLPAEGVADTVDEVEIALLVLSHQVAGAKPCVSRLEHVAEYLFLGRLLAGIAFKV